MDGAAQESVLGDHQRFGGRGGDLDPEGSVDELVNRGDRSARPVCKLSKSTLPW